MERQRRTGFARIALPIFVGIALVVTTLSVAAQASTLPTQSAGVNQAVSFAGSGFDPGERISLWTTAPAGQVTSLDAITANTDGSFVTSVAFPSDGFWQVTAQGTTSGRSLIGAYNVGTGSAPVTSGTGSTVLPPTGGGSAVAIGQTVTFTGSGFSGNELVSMWMTAPDSQVTALPGVSADANGRIAVPVSFSSAGYWQVTAQGLGSNVQSISGYSVGGSSATSGGAVPAQSGTGFVPPQPGTGVVPSQPGAGVATVGRIVTFTASGYTSGETVSAWTTAPDSQVVALPSGVADANGNVSFSTTFATPGYWQVTTKGVTSGVQKIVGYNVTG